MKKILCLMLVLVLSFGIVSCKKDKGDDDNNDNTSTNNNVDPFGKFTTALAGNNASKVVVDVTTVTALGSLEASYEVYFALDGSATIKYEYERFLEIGEGSPDEIKTTEPGTVYRNKDGQYSTTAGVDVSAIEAASVIDLASLKGKATVNAAGDELNVTVAKASTAAVFGTEFDSDVALKIILDGDNLEKIIITSETKKIEYNYEK